MSAPTELDVEALRRGLFTPVPRWTPTFVPDLLDDERDLLDTEDERRSVDLVAELSREHDQMCRDAVDPDEIAAGLEAAGLTDRDARERFGASSIFELADVLYERVPRRLSDTPETVDPWAHPLRRHLARGVLYAVPTLPFLAALQVLGTRASTLAVLLAGSVVSLAVTYGLSHVGHLLVGFGAPRSAARLLTRVLLATVVSTGAACAALVVTGVASGSMGLALGQLVYVVAATTLMVLDRGRLLLLLSLLPGAIASGAVLLRGDLSGGLPGVGDLTARGMSPDAAAAGAALVVAGLVSCLVLVVAAALYAAGPGLRVDGAGAVPRALPLVRREASRVAAHTTYGAMVAVLVAFAGLDLLWSVVPVGSGASPIGPAMLPMVASLGFSEWHLHRFRSHSDVIARRTHDFANFAREVRRALFLRVGGQAAVLLVGSGVVLGVAAVTSGVDAALVWRLAAYAVLGVALFVASILLSTGTVGPTVAAVTAAALGEGMLVPVLRDSTVLLTVAQTMVFSALLVALVAGAARSFGSPLRLR